MSKAGKPKILAPAGDKYSFLAAVAAGADAIYCGLKNFSARMEAENFSIEELSRLNALARSKNIQVYVAFNSLVKQNELETTSRIIAKLAKYVRPNALIIQDPGLIEVARKAGFKGEFHLSTLGNCSFPMGLESAENAGFSRVVLPRELTIDEIKLMANNKSANIDLEVFIHGALCYAVSGRCYWSSWFGGRSGMRGRCVQPCRRLYKQQSNEKRFFSCLDFSADVLVKVLKDIPGLTTWKIEGRKKSPHYVFYTVKAYKMLRDHGHDPAQKKIALSFLDYALGRPSTHYNLLPQNPINPLKKDKDMETGSGLFAGRVRYGGENLKPDIPNFITREALLTDDLLRIGYEDDSFHVVQRVTMPVPKKGRFIIKQNKSKGESLKQGKGMRFKKGSPVFIVDRREKEVWLLIKELETELEKYSSPDVRPQEINEFESSEAESIIDHTRQYINNHIKPSINNRIRQSINSHTRQSTKYSEICLYGYGDESKIKTAGRSMTDGGLWLSQSSVKRCSPKKIRDVWWFLPPVVWPVNQTVFFETLEEVLSKGAKNFVLNMPWQISCFNQITKQGEAETNSHINIKNSLSRLNLWAGPFCNIANAAYLTFLKKCGFSGAFVTPELGEENILTLPSQSPLPLGIAVKGSWPLAVSRIVSDEIILDELFASPRGESAWVTKKDKDFWIFPNWQLDLSNKKDALKQAGYELFLTIEECIPQGVEMKIRPGLWNWEIDLL
ncbi:MAG: U32 family peptidase [Desulfamplus sp.]|nr:U32 family peptidase [Desulfamplus sp.]